METAQLVSQAHGFLTTEVHGLTTARRNAAVPTLRVGKRYEGTVVSLRRRDTGMQPLFNLLIEIQGSHYQLSVDVFAMRRR
jgi:hypothetical protein